MDPMDFLKIIGLISIFVLVPLLWVLVRGRRSGDPEDAHRDYRIMEDTNRVHPRAIRSALPEWFKVKNEGDLKWLLTASPIRLTIAYSLLEGPATYKSLHDNVIKKLDENFGLKVSETSYIYQFDWLVDAKAIQKADEFYRLADLPADIIDLVNKRFRMKMKA